MASVRIPGIEIGEPLGHGAFSAVYMARRGDVACALKLPHTRGKWTRWVYREAVALARVHHPGLPRILEVGKVDEVPYLLMELVQGVTLADKLREGPLRPDEALELGCQLADALRAVHEVGLVHRDVKPKNILLDAKGDAKLVDFGFAAPHGSGTGAGPERAGTRRYSAPEQFRNPDRVDGRADLFALGKVLVECLSGQPPAESDAARVVVDLASAGVPAAVARIVGGLVAEAPEDRYPDAIAVLAELHRVRGGRAPRGAAASEPSHVQGPMVGRDAELDRALRAWREVEASGGRVIVVEGRRGSGKSRFLQACVRRVNEEGRGRSLESDCRSDDAPLSALRRVFDGYFSSLRWMAPQDRAAALSAARIAASGPLASLAAAICPTFTEMLGLSTPATAPMPDAFVEGAAELVVRLARQAGPLLLSFDDLQSMDALSRETIGAIADRASEAPLLIVAAVRHESGVDAADLLENLGHRRATRIQLGPLELRQSAALIASQLGVDSVQPAIVRRVVSMADDTPVGILEVLGAVLDAGALRLQGGEWKIDEAGSEPIALPPGAIAFLGRRLADLTPATRHVLDVAAILGSRFDDDLVSEVAGHSPTAVRQALADARRSGLLDLDGARGHRFAHESIREMLETSLVPAERRALHQRAAEHLASQPDLPRELVFACAMHYAGGDLERSSRDAYRICRSAGESALERFDSETALRCFDLAETAARAAGVAVDADFFNKVGEASVRTGALDEALSSFESALALASTDVDRARTLARIAWVHRARTEPLEAQEALARAFATLGWKAPTGEASQEKPPRAGGLRDDVLQTLCELYHQDARLAFEGGQPMRAFHGVMQVLALASSGGPSVPLVRAHATYGAVLLMMGRKAEAQRQLARAESMAASLSDPAGMAFYLPRRAVSLAADGRFDPAMKALRQVTEEYAPWLEVQEFCDLASNGDLIESVRGRAHESWKWIVRAIDRLRRRQRTSAVHTTYVLLRARAALATLGKSGEEGAWLTSQLDRAGDGSAEGPYYGALTLGPRARWFLDTGNLGPAFEALVGAFEARGADPAKAPLFLSEMYVVIAHARLQQWMRAAPGERPAAVAALSRAATNLRAAARLPLIQSHALLIDGALALAEGHKGKVRGLLDRAEALAERESCPWVSSAAARVRAHMLREGGKADAARDQARVAEMLATAHGAESRAKAIREEFGLQAPETARQANSSMASSVRGSSRLARRQLASLLQVARAPGAELDLPHQAAATVNDVVREVGADRGILVYEPSTDPRARLVVGRTRLGEELTRPVAWQDALLRAARSLGDAGEDDPTLALPMSPETPLDHARTITGSLFMNDRLVGVLVLERGPRDAAFSFDDRELVHVLSQQIPVALELARLLSERDQLHASFQQMQKMEVVGHLAGSVAHDFSNMLQAIGVGVEGLRANPALDDSAREDVDLLVDGMQRAQQLTAKLLSFSRQRPLPLDLASVNASIKSVEPLIRKLSTKTATVSLVLEPDPHVHQVLLDVASFEQAVVNLAVNARDAMPGGGKLTIRTRNASVDGDMARRFAVQAGDFVVVDVADTGEGMPPETLARIFDPFFTTKPAGKGTGLGLTTVYSFVRKGGGFVDVESEPGRGTTFHLYFPKAEVVQSRTSNRPAPSTRRPPAGSPMILVVDDDPIARESARAQLMQEGYRVVAADGSVDALRFVERQGGDIGLVILDVHMPDMGGVELSRKLSDLRVRAKVLFVTGMSDDLLPEDVPHDEARLLHKPFSTRDLLGRVRTLLEPDPRPTKH